jgi:hypothetical protein
MIRIPLAGVSKSLLRTACGLVPIQAAIRAAVKVPSGSKRLFARVFISWMLGFLKRTVDMGEKVLFGVQLLIGWQLKAP